MMRNRASIRALTPRPKVGDAGQSCGPKLRGEKERRQLPRRFRPIRKRQLHKSAGPLYHAAMMIRLLTLLPLVLAVSACASMQLGGRKAASPAASPGMATEFAPAVSTSPLGTKGQAVAALDQTSAAEKAAALAAPVPAAGRELGRAVVSLGAPAEQGLWVATPLVSAPSKGRVVGPSGQSLAVELRPATGGAQMSLAAYQALGIGLTELPALTIFGS